MNIQIVVIVLIGVLFLAGCATVKVPPINMSNPEVRAAYEKGQKEGKAEILVIDKCRAKNKGRASVGVPSSGDCGAGGGDYSPYYYRPYYYRPYIGYGYSYGYSGGWNTGYRMHNNFNHAVDSVHHNFNHSATH
ncbi:MAG TPA: hypothetical protein ENI66_00040 [Candidatus Yonathbacteria bacterium]|nr:hypothetical protein [Candidatus Yonathbacteria bacterium]